MTFDQLMCFSVLADTLNYTRAAEILYISQPTMSRQITLLEQEFGIVFFNRSYKSLNLTPAGEVFLEECRKVLSAERQLRTKMSVYQLGKSGAISCSSLDLYYPQLQRVFRQFRIDNPDIQLLMLQKNTGETLYSVLSGESDMGICFSYELTGNEEVEVLPLFQEDFRIVVADTHPLADKEFVTPDDLRGENLLLLENSQFPFTDRLWLQLQKSGAVQGITLDRSQSLKSILLNIRAGNYISFFPSPMTRPHLEGCSSLEIRAVDSSYHTILIWRKKNNNPTLNLLINAVEAEFGL